MKTFYIKTLGCKVNSYESEFIRNLFLENNFTEVDENADVCIVNTCTVTNTSDNKSKQVVNNIRKNNPDAIVVAMGCFCQFRNEEIENLINADIILGIHTNSLCPHCHKKPQHHTGHGQCQIIHASVNGLFCQRIPCFCCIQNILA